MTKTYSIAGARSELPELIHDVERGEPVTITRRGKPVAVVLSVREYERIAPRRPTFAEAYDAWRRSVAPTFTGVSPDHFASLRDGSAGRPVKL